MRFPLASVKHRRWWPSLETDTCTAYPCLGVTPEMAVEFTELPSLWPYGSCTGNCPCCFRCGLQGLEKESVVPPLGSWKPPFTCIFVVLLLVWAQVPYLSEHWGLPGPRPGPSRGSGQVKMAPGFVYEVLPFLSPAPLRRTTFLGHPALGCFWVELGFAVLPLWNSVSLLGFLCLPRCG